MNPSSISVPQSGLWASLVCNKIKNGFDEVALYKMKIETVAIQANESNCF
jgi:hypothetical protein